MRSKPKWISDEELLLWIKCGVLVRRICEETGEWEIWKFHFSRRTYLKLQPWQDKRTGRWRYVLRKQEKSRTVHRNKLFWMIEHRRLPAEGCHIDHRDHDNQNDHPSNLRERDSSCNCADNSPTGYAEDLKNREEAAKHGSAGDF